MITLKDIAARCGKNVSTVSRALRDDPRVRAKTRDAIQTLAAEMGYRPNLAARRLVAGSSQTIWFIMANLNHPLSQIPAQAAGISLQQHGYDLLVAPYHRDEDALLRIVDRLSQGVCDGAIMIPGGPAISPQLADLVKTGYPLVFLDRHLEGISAPVVTTDNDVAAGDLLTHCLNAGAEAVISLFSNRNPVEKARQDGCRMTALEHHCPFFEEDQLTRLPKHLAIMASSQEIMLEFIRKHNEQLAGRHLYFALFDSWEGNTQPAKNVFVCIQDMKTMGQKAAEILTRRLAGKTKRAVFRKITVPYKTIKRIYPFE